MPDSTDLTKAPTPATLPWGVLAAWGAAIMVTCVIAGLTPTKRTLYPLFSNAGRTWTANKGVYLFNPTLDRELVGFRYSPLVAEGFGLMGLMPDRLGGIVWRLFISGIFIIGFAWASQTLMPGWSSLSQAVQQMAWLLALPLCLANMHNGQANLLVIGLLLIGTASLVEERWTLSALCLTVACLFKVYPIAAVMLVVLLYPWKMGPRFFGMLLLGLAAPFALRSPTFVLQEYRNWIHVMTADNRFGDVGLGYRDLSLLLRLAHAPVDRTQFLFIQAGLGIVAALAILMTKLRTNTSPSQLLLLAFNLGVFWMLLCGPASESSTYVFLAPTAAWLAADALRGAITGPARGLILGGFALVMTTLLASLFGINGTIHPLGFHPLGTLLLAIGFLTTFYAKDRNATSIVLTPFPEQPEIYRHSA